MTLDIYVPCQGLAPTHFYHDNPQVKRKLQTSTTIKIRCKGITKKGKRCGNAPMPDSEYCRFHDPRLRSLILSKWRKVLSVTAVSLILSSLGIAYTMYYGRRSPTKDQVTELHEDVKDLVKQKNELYGQQRIQELPKISKDSLDKNITNESIELLAKGRKLLKEINFAGARDVLKRVEKRHQIWYSAFLLGRVAFGEGKFNGSVLLFQKAEERYFQFLSTNTKYVELSKNQILSDIIHEASKPLENGMVFRWIDPQLSLIYNNLGSAFYKVGRLEEAEETLRLAIKIQPQDDLAMDNLASTLINQNKLIEAEKISKSAISINRNDPYAYVNLGNIKRISNNIDEAKSYYEKATRKQPELSQAWAGIGEIALDRLQYSQAVNAFQKACNLNEKDASSYNNLGIALGKLGRKKEAVHAIQKALTFDTTNVAFLVNLGFAYFEARGLDPSYIDKSKDTMGRVLGIDPKSPQAHLGVANILELRSKIDQAIIYYETFLSLSEERSCCEQARSAIKKKLRQYREKQMGKYGRLIKHEKLIRKASSISDEYLVSTVVNDILFISREWGDKVDNHTIRRGSVILKRLLIEGDLIRAWEAVGLDGKPHIWAPCIEHLLRSDDANKIEFIIAGGGKFAGHTFALSIINRGDSPVNPPKDVNIIEHDFELEEFVESCSIYVENKCVSRKEVISYVADKLGGARIDLKREYPLGGPSAILDRCADKFRIIGFEGLTGKNAIFFELLSIGQLLAKSKDIQKLIEKAKNM